MKKTVIILSGGMDSTVLAYYLAISEHELHAISFHYGQKHSKELDCAAITCRKLGVSHEIVNLCNLAPLLSSSLTRHDIPVPEGHYADDNMKSTVVPNRNMIMLSIAAGYAITIGASGLAYGCHAGDHAIYPDCRPVFRDAMSVALSLCDYNGLELHTPFLDYNKIGICDLGLVLGVPFEDTWTCYKGEEKPCGVCGSCVERAEAFATVGAEDPLCLY